MATSGPNNPSSGTSIYLWDPRIQWVNPGNIFTSNNGYAVLTGDDPHDALLAKGFGFSIPTGATIDGIVAEIERKASVASSYADQVVALTKDGSSVVGSSNADIVTTYPTTDTYKTYGSSSDLWGTTWTAAEINSADFGLWFEVYTGGGEAGYTVSVDHIRITVHYTPAAGGTGNFFNFMRKAWEWLFGKKQMSVSGQVAVATA